MEAHTEQGILGPPTVWGAQGLRYFLYVLVSLTLPFLSGQPMKLQQKMEVREESKIGVLNLLAPSQGITWDCCVWQQKGTAPQGPLLTAFSDLVSSNCFLRLSLSGLGVVMTLPPIVTSPGHAGSFVVCLSL